MYDAAQDAAVSVESLSPIDVTSLVFNVELRSSEFSNVYLLDLH